MNICVITVVDAINSTSMPINEYVIYRAMHKPEIRQVLVVCTGEKYNGVEIPPNVDVRFVERDYVRMRRTIQDIVKSCKREKVKYVFHLNGQSSSFVFIMATMFMGLGRFSVFTIHSLCSARNLKYRVSSYLCAIYANWVTCVSGAAYLDYPRIIRKVKANRMLPISNAIDFKHLDEVVSQIPAHVDTCDMNRLICIDRVIPLKNQSFLVRLLKYLPQTKLALVGIPDENGEVYKLAKQEGVSDRLEYTGLLKREDVYRQLNMSGLYVTASTIEGLHNSVLEAMGVGVIPLISDIPAHHEITEKIGLVAPLPFDEEKWVEIIRKYQDLDKVSHRDLSEKLKKRVKEEYSLDKMHEKFIDVFKQVAAI